MPFQDLSKMGMRPTQGSAGGFLNGIITAAEAALPAYKEAKEDRAKREKDKVDQYYTLRKAGYTKEEAYDATLKGIGYNKPVEPDDSSFDIDNETKQLKRDKAKLDLEKAEQQKKEGWPGTKPTQKQEQESQTKRAQIKSIISGKGWYDKLAGFQDLKSKQEMKAYLTQEFEGVYNPEDPELNKMIEETYGVSKAVTAEAAKQPEQKGGNWLSNFISKFSGKEASYSESEEQLIQDNMEYYKRGREEVVNALINAGKLKRR